MISQDKLNTNPWRLTPAQLRVIESLSRLGAYKLVARELVVSEKTVETHMSAIKTRMEAPNQIQAVVKFIDWQRTASVAEPQP